jgi:hypothetical protein
VLREVDYIVARAAESDARVVTLGQLVLFSTQSGDTWLLDPEDHLALRLATDGGRLPVQIVETTTRFAIQWNASYRFEDDAFVVDDGSGMRAIIGYPVADLRVAERRALRRLLASIRSRSIALHVRCRCSPAQAPSSRS